MVKITEVLPHSLAYKAGVREGQTLVKINGNDIKDVLDYRFYLTDKKIILTILDGEKEISVKIKKQEYEDIGLEFETALMDNKQRCKNGCIFCFIDQNPEGMREPIYFKDDDSRLSFIHGNYVTLTNMTDADVERIIKMRMSPINISVHTTNPDLRVRMMKNKRAGEVLRYLEDFAAADLTMAGQIVLCRGINDGAELERSLNDLATYYPAMSSVAIVPAGLTKHREGLCPLSDFTCEEAGAVIDLVEKKASECLEKHGERVFFAADEFYLKAGRPLPEGVYYESYPQIDNGVGLLRSMLDEFEYIYSDAAAVWKKSGVKARKVTLATGTAAYPFMRAMAMDLCSACPGLEINVECIRNNFFGESITVAGLLTGKDIYEQLSGKELGDELLIPAASLREEDEDFLCGMTVDELADKLSVPILASDGDGISLVEAMLGMEVEAEMLE